MKNVNSACICPELEEPSFMGGGERSGITTHRKKEIANIMGNIHRDPHIREMKSIAQPNQNQCNNMMSHQLPKILPRLFQLQKQHNRLLCPIASLEQIVGLEQALVGLVRVVLEHGTGIKIPDGGPTHNVETEGTKDRKVNRGVDLFHEPGLFGAGVDAARLRKRADESLHEKFAGEGEDDDVEGDEGEVAWSFAILGRSIGTTEGVGGD